MSDPAPQLSPTSFTPDEIVRLQEADRKAAEAGTPRGVLDALMPEKQSFAGHPTHDPTLDTVLALEAIDSPFLVEGVKVGIIHLAEALLLLTTPPVEVAELVSDRQIFRARVHEFARSIPISQIGGAQDLVTGTLNKAFSTHIPTGKPSKGETKKKGRRSPGN